MLQILYSIDEIRYSQLMAVYEESNRSFGKIYYPYKSANEQLLESEQDLYSYLRSVFFKTRGGFYAVWTVSGKYVSALRAEPYEDGFLINGLETRPDQRNMGYAQDLLLAVVKHLIKSGNTPVYSHIEKHNTLSVRLHEKVGFHLLHRQHAVLLDGTVSKDTLTYVIK